MTTTTHAPSTAKAPPALSTGLGGPLWILAWALAMLPLVATAGSIASVWRYPPILDPGDDLYRLHNVTLVWHLSLMIALWRAALLFFRRAAGFPAAWWLLVAVLWLGLIVTQALYAGLRPDTPWHWSTLLDMRMKDALLFLAPVALALYLSLSPHARRAFRGIDAACWGPSELPGVLRRGPDDWSRGVWLIPGLLIYAALVHATGTVDLATEALQPMPAPERHVTGEIVLSGTPSRDHVQATRLQWGLHLLALSLLPFVCHAFMCRRPRTVWLVVALLSITIVAPLPWIVIDPPPIYADGPDHEAQLLSAIVLSLIVLPALWSARKRGRFGHASGSGPLPAPNEPLSDAAQDADR